MQADGLGHLPPGPEDRVEGGHRVLKDHRDVLAAYLAHLAFGDLGEVAALEHDLAAQDPSRTLEAHDAQRRHRLAAARLADDAQRLSGADLEGHAIDRFHHARLGFEDGVEVLDLEQCLGHYLSLGSKASRRALPKTFMARTVMDSSAPGSRTSQIER